MKSDACRERLKGKLLPDENYSSKQVMSEHAVGPALKASIQQPSHT